MGAHASCGFRLIRFRCSGHSQKDRLPDVIPQKFEYEIELKPDGLVTLAFGNATRGFGMSRKRTSASYEGLDCSAIGPAEWSQRLPAPVKRPSRPEPPPGAKLRLGCRPATAPSVK